MSKLAVTFRIEGTAYIIPDNEKQTEEQVLEMAEKYPNEFDKHLDIKKVENVSVISEGWK
ncbi:hypothetical protein [Staphylococcus haemolyticus]|uniref:hypothetical protein n=1 Tax=Staphylococcus haemolyticus TaxID=1283 RepID=UPI0028FE5EBE|nr:hypothetical protein [Staphylococcus haemolyticus]MDU0439395.1 hypothetical protein [Staphylococcus haemolyticus]